ncbi:hypothetical protein FPOA_14088 [Fusarium poae]|uniref:Uncharacterized protein n=1 Tax=Fusarium poae TaxID=36050 RepID=A0A1B8A3L6_FUSPO|nr:hypothetical protein FPOA_14088 [Fusarium poae]
MGRRALSAQEKADKATRERDRLRQYRLAARQNENTQPDDIHPPNTVIPLLAFPSTFLTRIAQKENSASMNNGEERENTTLHQTNNQTASAIPRRSRTPPTNRSIVATHEPITRVDETALPSKSSTQLIGEYDTHPSTICVTAQYSGAVDNRDTTIIDDEVESISLVQVLSSNSPVLGPPLSPRERTRLRVQRHRDQRHLTAYVEDGNDDDTPGDLRFNNDAASDSPVSVRPLWTGSARHNSQSLQRRSSAFSSTPSSRVSSSSPPPGPSSVSSAGGDKSILSGYLQVIREQDTAGGPDFLRAQSVVYDRVLRTFFNHQCNCPNSHERAEPESTHTLQECTEYIGRYLPPLPTIFAQRDNAYDPRASFPQWQDFLSDKPPERAEPLSLRKTQASLPHGSVVVARQWDVDSIWLGAKSLSAIRAPGHFRLSFFPAYKSNISTAQVIQPHGLDLAHTRHTSIGTFITAGVRFSVLVFFPNGARSRTKASANSLSLARFRDLYDEIILPAIFETVPDHVRQEIPSSYDLLYAKSRAYQEKPGAGRWSAEDESRAFRLSYSIPASNLAEFWTSVVEKANLHRVQTKRGEVVPYFENPRLLFQAHDLKNTFVSQTVEGSLALFRDIVLAGLNASQIDMHSCWLDVGMRDHVSQLSSPSPAHRDEPWTLLWKSACSDHLHDQLGGVVPEAPLVADQYRSYLLRDVGTYYAKAKPSRASNPGHPEPIPIRST